MRGRTTGGVALVLGMALIPAVLAAQSIQQGDAKKGKAHYEQYCAICHGARGLGNGSMAKATSPPAPKLTTREIREKSDEAVLNAIANGVGGSMPAWRGVLNDRQLRDVVAYVRALAGG